MAHTPGPWHVVTGSVYTGIDWDGKSDPGVPIASMDREPGNGTRPVERDANARLIAAAPDLLAALEGLVDRFDGSEDGEAVEFVAARAAIDKAKG
ncbi:hypothetical protein LCGC14_1356680 [marine sediment metagenome]|uniref:Uncharacterized protein n=1 Tax=marine sediment metagenome TaxID=412755 RepID=A0A0F9K9C0_9ZZZZ